ncbi:MAG: DUF5615 family PIN-like protein [Acidobacteria bacterium]|nr:DUF5615 family PIN-like protein [Acidobacteriota bacterium]
MILVADESVDLPIVIRLRENGHTIWYVAEMQPGLPDDAVLNLSNHYAAPLLTADKGFGELVFHQKRVTSGVILLRLAGLLSETKAEIVATAVRQHGTEFSHR